VDGLGNNSSKGQYRKISTDNGEVENNISRDKIDGLTSIFFPKTLSICKSVFSVDKSQLRKRIEYFKINHIKVSINLMKFLKIQGLTKKSSFKKILIANIKNKIKN
jgi:hypothetical protein